MTSVVPQTRAARQRAIVDILAGGQIGSQGELRSRLADLGIDATQATLSRDLLELRATKVRNDDGVQVYTVRDLDGSPTHEAESSTALLQRWTQDLLVGVDRVDNQLVIRTPVGAANLLGSAIDAVRWKEVAGTIAGDDTILLICRSEGAAEDVCSRLLSLADPHAAAV